MSLSTILRISALLLERTATILLAILFLRHLITTDHQNQKYTVIAIIMLTVAFCLTLIDILLN